MGSAITREVNLEVEVSENVPTEEEWERTHLRGTEINKISGAVCICKKATTGSSVGPEMHLDSWRFEPGLPGHQYSECPYLLVGSSWLSNEMEVTFCTCQEFAAVGLQVRCMLECLPAVSTAPSSVPRNTQRKIKCFWQLKAENVCIFSSSYPFPFFFCRGCG